MPHRDTRVRRRGLERDVLIVTCAISAGIHGALVPEHLAEGAGPGGGFIASTALLVVLAVALSFGAGERAVLAAGAVLAGLIAAYGLAVSTGVPVLHPEAEPVDGLALFTKAVEALGLAAAITLLGRPAHLLHPQERTNT
jgi:hypothetical protein